MNVEIETLTVLDDVDPKMMPEHRLYADAHLASGTDMGPAEYKLRLKAMETRGEIYKVTHRDWKAPKWGILQPGKTRLIQANS